MIHLEEAKFPGPESLGEIKLSDLGGLTLLFGKNGSGKSRILRAFRDSDPVSVHYVAPERVGSFNFNPNFIQAELSPIGRTGGVAGNIATHYHDRALGRIASYFMKRGAEASPTAETSAAAMAALVQDLLPGIAVRFQPEDPPVVLKRVKNDAPISSVDELSSGESQLLTLAIDVLTIAAIWALERRPKRLLLLDEPDTHIHPDLQLRFAGLLREVASNYSIQIVIATHSISLLSACANVWPQGEVRLGYVKPGFSNIRCHPFDVVRRELTTCLGGHVLMGPLFGMPLLLVEGMDDFMVWSQAARQEPVSCAVLPCNGEEIVRYQKRLEELLGATQDVGLQGASYT